MRFLASPLVATAVMAAAAVPFAAARAEPAAETPVACVNQTGVAAAKLIDSCSAVIANPATPDADRLDAMVTRARVLCDSGQTDRALAELDKMTSSARLADNSA